MEEYAKTIHIEALTSLDMLDKMIIPACMEYSGEIAKGVAAKVQIGIEALSEKRAIELLTEKTAQLMTARDDLVEAVAREPAELNARGLYQHEVVIPAMERARTIADDLEHRVAKKYWPMPTYADLLFYV